jgi:hypothetical protein
LSSRAQICYVPAFSVGSVRRFDSTFYLDDAMLLDQFSIVQALAAQTSIDSVVKCLRGAESSVVLRAFIQDLGVANVRYSEARLSDELPRASAGLLDYPSSSLREIADAGLPLLVLAYPGLHVRTSALESLPGVTFASPRERAEIAGHITAFVETLQARAGTKALG